MRPPPESTKHSLTWHLRQHARDRWPGLAEVHVRFRSEFAYVDGERNEGEIIKLCRLRYTGSATNWGFAIYRASHDDYHDNVLPSGWPTGSPKTHSIAPAASTSATQRHRIHRRTNARQH